MASHQVAIAKAALSAGLLRPDPVSVPRDEIANFHVLLDKAVARCSPTNVQQCKRWLLAYTTQSAARLKALGKYLAALSGSFDATTDSKPSAKRKRLHLLYLLNDVLHHCRERDRDSAGQISVAESLQPYLTQLVTTAAALKNCPKHQRKIRDLLGIWNENRYFAQEFISELRDNADAAATARSSAADKQDSTTAALETEAQQKVDAGMDAPYVMPAAHGDPSTPYYDLPAANMMPHIVPNSLHPINPQLLKPLQLVPGPAESSLVAAVKDFLQDVDKIFEGQGIGDATAIADIDELGQPVVKNDVTGEIVATDSYYGWSKAFCDKMKDMRRGRYATDSRRRGRSNSRGRSASPRKRRRRYSYSDSDSRSRDRSRSYSRSRSRMRYQDCHAAQPRRPYSRSRSRSRRSDSLRRGRRRSRSYSRSRSRSRSYSPRLGTDTVARPSNPAMTMPPQPPSLPASGNPFPTAGLPNPVVFAQFIAQNPHILPAGVPVPPPPLLPNGHFIPPPPPALPALSGNVPLGPNGPRYPAYPGMPVPPPPPPPPSGPRGYQGPSGMASSSQSSRHY